MPSSLHEWFEPRHDLDDGAPHLLEHVAEPISPFEGYVSGTADLHIQVRVWPQATTVDSQDLCAWIPKDSLRTDPPAGQEIDGPTRAIGEHPVERSEEPRLECPVLVQVRELLQNRKGVLLGVPLSPPVRLKRPDDCDLPAIHSRQAFGQPIVEVFSICVDGVLHAPLISFAEGTRGALPPQRVATRCGQAQIGSCERHRQ